MERDDILKSIYNAIVDLDKDELLKMVDLVIQQDINLTAVITDTMSPAMAEVGRQFQVGEKFLPELQMSADVFQAAMDVLEPRIMEQKGDIKPKGKVVIGTVKGDLHSIGKDLVATMLKTNGFVVSDLGIDVSPDTFLAEAESMGANVIALSALLTTTMPAQRDVVEALKSKGLRDKYRVIVGGAPVDQTWADKIGADGYGATAPDAVKMVQDFCG